VSSFWPKRTTANHWDKPLWQSESCGTYFLGIVVVVAVAVVDIFMDIGMLQTSYPDPFEIENEKLKTKYRYEKIVTAFHLTLPRWLFTFSTKLISEIISNICVKYLETNCNCGFTK